MELFIIKDDKEKEIGVWYLPSILKKYYIVTSFYNDYGLVFYLGNNTGRLHTILLVDNRK